MRKHENFHWGGYKYAPESVWFSINGKHINFPEDVRSRLAYLAVCGEKEKLLIELKRALREEEKKPRVVGKCMLETGYEVTEGKFNPYGKSKEKRKTVTSIVDLKRCRSISVIREPIFG